MEYLKSRDRISRDDMFIKICGIVSQRSTCLRSQVGALIVRDGRIVSMGYNGPVSGMPACIYSIPPEGMKEVSTVRGDTLGWELELDQDKIRSRMCMGPGCTRSLHAETNAIAFAAKAGVSVDGCTMYCSMSPCINCAKVIVNSGIKELKYLRSYRDESGLKLLREAGIKVEKLSLRENSGDELLIDS